MLYSTSQPSRWWGLKTLQRGLRFSSIFWSSTIQGKTEEEHFCDFCSEALQSLQSRPWARPAHVANSWPRARLQVLKNSGSWMFMFKVKTLSAQNCHWWNPRKKRAAIQKVRKSVHWWAQCHAKWQSGCREFQHPTGIKHEPPYSLRLTLTTKPWIRVNLQKKMVYNLMCFATCNPFLSAGLTISDCSQCSGWIWRPGTKYQNSWTQNCPCRKPLIDSNLIHLIAFNIDLS